MANFDFKGNKSGIASTCCRDCTERFPACHDVCATYLAAKAEYQEKQAQIREAKDKERIYDKYHYNQVTKRRKSGEKIYVQKRKWVH